MGGGLFLCAGHSGSSTNEDIEVKKVTDIKDKMDKCEYCGEPSHPRPLMCPRIKKVKYDDDCITVYFDSTPILFSVSDFAIEEE